MDDVEEPPSGGPNVSLADAAIAAAIGRAAASGRGPDRAPTLEQELQSQIDAAATDLADEECAALRARGRSLDLATGVALALELCERPSSFE